MSRRRGSAMTVALLAGDGTAWASYPMQAPICFAHDHAAVVFVGTVVSIQPASGPQRSGVVTHVQFNAVERLKGAVDREVLTRG